MTNYPKPLRLEEQVGDKSISFETGASDRKAGSDGTGVTDLEENLRTNFRLYDIIKFSLSGLTVTGAGGVLQACYNTVITSRILKRNLTHEEKAAVCDELKRENGKLRISRTLSGSYWYIK